MEPLHIRIRSTSLVLLFVLGVTVGYVLGAAWEEGATLIDMAGDLLVAAWIVTIVEFFWIIFMDWVHSPNH